MKKIILKTSLPVMILTLMSFSSGSQSTSTPQEQLANDGGIKITCPDGDWYTCYQQGNNWIVYKGEGKVVIDR